MHKQTLFKSFNNNNTKRETKARTNTTKAEENWKYISNIVFVIIKCKTKARTIQKNRRQELKIKVYVLYRMVVTPDTAHFEISLLKASALINAVQTIQYQEYKNGKERQETDTKEEENWK